MVSTRSYQIIFAAISTCALIFLFSHELDERSRLVELEKAMKLLENNVPCQAYRKQCFSLYKKLRYPDEKYKFNPPVKEIPKELYENFTQHGYMPLTKYWYFNDAYSDSFSTDKAKKTPVDVANFNMYREKVKNWQPLGYEDVSFHVTMDQYKSEITSKSIVNKFFIHSFITKTK